MQMVKIKLFDTNITFTNNPRHLWICGTTQIFYVIVQNVEQPAFAQILSPSSLTHDYFTLCSCADDTNKAINNILSLPKTE